MAEIFETSASDSVNSAVRKRMEDFLRADPEYLKIGKPSIRAVTDAAGKTAAYAVTMRKVFPDAYFDMRGNFLFAPGDVIGYGGWAGKGGFAKDASDMAGFSDAKSASGVREWRKSTAKGGELLDPFSSETFEILKNLSFQHDRLNVNRRIYVKESSKDANVPPYGEDDVKALLDAKSLTIREFVRLRSLGLVESRIFEKYRRDVALLLPSQLLDSRFAASIERTDAQGVTREIRPGWHAIGKADVEDLFRQGFLDAKTRDAAIRSLETLEKRSKDVLGSVSRTRASLESLKASLA